MTEKKPMPHPCVYCGGRQMRIKMTSAIWQLQCVECGARGPGGLTEEEATARWNDRRLAVVMHHVV